MAGTALPYGRNFVKPARRRRLLIAQDILSLGRNCISVTTVAILLASWSGCTQVKREQQAPAPGPAPTPSSSATLTPGPIPTSTATPVGVAPPAGKAWVNTLDDEFPGTSVNTNVWNYGYSNDNSRCRPGGCIEGQYCAQILACNDDATQHGSTSGTGGTFQPFAGESFPGGGILNQLGVYPDGLGEHCDGDACGGSANINSATKFVQHYGYWEYSVKWPPNVPGASGEDHDFWLALDGTDSGCNNGIDQINMDENSNGGNGVAGTGSQYSDQLSVSDCTSNGIPNYIVFGHTGADFSAGFHAFGMSWLPNGTKNGIITFYIDGIQQGQYQLSNTGNAWANGLYTIVSNSYCAAGGILGGGPCTGDGTHPTQVKYVRVWQVSRTPRGQQ